MKRLLLLLILASFARAQNTAKFPLTTLTNADLGVARNRAETTLATGINATATSIPVASSSGFAAGSFVTIDNEILAVCSIPDGNHLSVGVSSCPNVDGRGTDTANGGGAAASHLAGAKVQARIVAWNQNQAAAELIAMARKVHAESVSVIDYGAVGDGSTDNAAAFAAAAAWVNAGSGRTLIFPDGTYKYTGGLAFTSGVRMLCGPGATLNYSGTGYAVKFGADGLIEATHYDEPFKIEGCTFIGGAANEHGIYVNEFITNFILEGTRFNAFGPTSTAKWAVWLAGGNWRAWINHVDWWNESVKCTNFVSGADDPNTQLKVLNTRATQGSHCGKGIRLVGWHNSVSDGQTDFFTEPLIIGTAAGYSTVNNWYMETYANNGCIGYDWAQAISVTDSYCNLHGPDMGATGSFLYPRSGSAQIINSAVTRNRVKGMHATAFLVKQNAIGGQTGNTASDNIVNDIKPVASTVTHNWTDWWSGTDAELPTVHGVFDNTANVWTGNNSWAGVSFFLNYVALENGKTFIGYSDALTTQKWLLNAATGDGVFQGFLDAVGGLKVGGTTVVDSTRRGKFAGGFANKAICWKADGITLGYCSTQPDAFGACTCN